MPVQHGLMGRRPFLQQSLPRFEVRKVYRVPMVRTARMVRRVLRAIKDLKALKVPRVFKDPKALRGPKVRSVLPFLYRVAY